MTPQPPAAPTGTGASPSFSGVSLSPYPGIAQHLPVQLRNLRAQRFRGEHLDASLSALNAADQDRVRRLYAYAKGTYGLWLAMREAPDWAALREQVLSILDAPLSGAAQDLGRDTMAHLNHHPTLLTLSKVLHDLRGGALLSLQLYAQLARWDGDPMHLRSAAFLARDQAKIMRNALPDLDPETRQADESEKPHFMQTVVDKWNAFRFENAQHQTGQVHVTCEYDGLLASCCLEASAVDRVVYNYVNNAIRFSAGPSIRMEILPVGGDAVRWVVANPMSPDQSAWLRQETAGDLSTLFRGGVTRGGNGLGLSNCAEFVAAAFGLPDIHTALSGRYLGARVEGDWYLAWAHWPALYANEAVSR